MLEMGIQYLISLMTKTITLVSRLSTTTRPFAISRAFIVGDGKRCPQTPIRSVEPESTLRNRAVCLRKILHFSFCLVLLGESFLLCESFLPRKKIRKGVSK